MKINNLLKSGAIVVLVFMASCHPEKKSDEKEVHQTIVIGTDTVYLNKYGQVIEH